MTASLIQPKSRSRRVQGIKAFNSKTRISEYCSAHMRDDLVYIEDIVLSISVIQEHVEDKSELDFENSLLLQDAVYRSFEIIGEAATKISEKFKEAHPEIERWLMKLMRNKLIHEYFGISAASVFATVREDLP